MSSVSSSITTLTPNDALERSKPVNDPITKADRLSIMLAEAAYHLQVNTPEHLKMDNSEVKLLIERLHAESDRIHNLAIKEEKK